MGISRHSPSVSPQSSYTRLRPPPGHITSPLSRPKWQLRNLALQSCLAPQPLHGYHRAPHPRRALEPLRYGYWLQCFLDHLRLGRIPDGAPQPPTSGLTAILVSSKKPSWSSHRTSSSIPIRGIDLPRPISPALTPTARLRLLCRRI